jgi:hypothetical protein
LISDSIANPSNAKASTMVEVSALISKGILVESEADAAVIAESHL